MPPGLIPFEVSITRQKGLNNPISTQHYTNNKHLFKVLVAHMPINFYKAVQGDPDLFKVSTIQSSTAEVSCRY